MKWQKEMLLATVLAVPLSGCTTVQRNQVALGLCVRTPGCTASEKPPESNGPPQVRAMEGEGRERILNPRK